MTVNVHLTPHPTPHTCDGGQRHVVIIPPCFQRGLRQEPEAPKAVRRRAVVGVAGGIVKVSPVLLFGREVGAKASPIQWPQLLCEGHEVEAGSIQRQQEPEALTDYKR